MYKRQCQSQTCALLFVAHAKLRREGTPTYLASVLEAEELVLAAVVGAELRTKNPAADCRDEDSSWGASPGGERTCKVGIEVRC